MMMIMAAATANTTKATANPIIEPLIDGDHYDDYEDDAGGEHDDDNGENHNRCIIGAHKYHVLNGVVLNRCRK